MFGKNLALNEQTMNIIEEIGRHLPGGFFIYKAEGDEDLLYANEATDGIRIGHRSDKKERSRLGSC